MELFVRDQRHCALAAARTTASGWLAWIKNDKLTQKLKKIKKYSFGVDVKVHISQQNFF